MSTLLYVECSPRKERSASIDVANAFLDVYRARHPADTIDTLDVWATALPEFNGAALEAKYAGIEGLDLNAEQAAAWATIRTLADRFRRADKYLFSVPMWNYSIPYKLKHLIDCVSQKDLLFTFDANGLNGLLTGRKAAVIYARGIEYTAAAGLPPDVWDLQRQYLELWLRSVGVTDLSSVLIEKTLYGPEADAAARISAKAHAEALAARF